MRRKSLWITLLLLIIGVELSPLATAVVVVVVDGESGEEDAAPQPQRWKPLFLRRHRNQKNEKLKKRTAPSDSTDDQSTTFSAFSYANETFNFIYGHALAIHNNIEQLLPPKGAFASTVSRDIQQFSERFQTDIQQLSDGFAQEVKSMQQEFKKHLLRDVFKQRIGWERFRHSLRDHLGFFVGLWVTFRGRVDKTLAVPEEGGTGGAVALHFAQVLWHILFTTSIQLGHSPWLGDLLSILVADVFWRQGIPRLPSRLVQGIPHLLFGITLLPLTSLFLEEWAVGDTERNNENASFSKVVTVAALSYLVLKLAHVPIPLAASSLSGAILVYDSARAEIAGNWLRMMEDTFLVARPVLHLISRLLFLLVHPAMWLWKKWLKQALHKIFYPQVTKNVVARLISFLQNLWRATTAPFTLAKDYVANLTLIQRLNVFSLNLRRAIRPVMIPIGIAMWGVAVQMDYITNIGGAWKVLRLSLDPVTSVRERVISWLSPKSRARKALIRILQAIPRRMQRHGQNDDPV